MDIADAMVSCKECSWKGREEELRDYQSISSTNYHGHEGCPDCGSEDLTDITLEYLGYKEEKDKFYSKDSFNTQITIDFENPEEVRCVFWQSNWEEIVDSYDLSAFDSKVELVESFETFLKHTANNIKMIIFN